MSIRDIIVSVDYSEIGRERLGFALDFARRHGAHLVACYTAPTVAEGMEGTPSEIAEALQLEFEQGLAARDLQGDWLLAEPPLVDDITAQIRHADLAILGLGSPDSDDGFPQGFRVADVVRGCGRPILGMPVSRLGSSAFRRVLVAWDGSREATRALHDALPLLADAELISIASIGPGEHAWPDRVVRHLARHGLEATVDTTPPYESAVGAELLQRAAMNEIDLIVAGAYGRSKLSEDLFGGASNALLHQMLVPILLSH